MKTIHFATINLLLCSLFSAIVSAAEPWVVYDGFGGPGNGKHVVLVS